MDHEAADGQPSLIAELQLSVVLASAGLVLFAGAWAGFDTGATAALDRAGLSAGRLFGELVGSGAGVAGTLGVVLCGLVAVTLALRAALAHRFACLLTALVGAVLCQALCHVLKSAVDRARPPGGLVHAGGLSFPSTTSALGVGLIALSFRVGRGDEGSARADRVVGPATCATIGVGCVLFRVHYTSDVLAGWGAGLAVFAFVWILAIAVASARSAARR